MVGGPRLPWIFVVLLAVVLVATWISDGALSQIALPPSSSPALRTAASLDTPIWSGALPPAQQPLTRDLQSDVSLTSGKPNELSFHFPRPFPNGQTSFFASLEETEVDLAATQRLVAQAVRLQNIESQGDALLALQSTVEQLQQTVAQQQLQIRSMSGSFTAMGSRLDSYEGALQNKSSESELLALNESLIHTESAIANLSIRMNEIAPLQTGQWSMFHNSGMQYFLVAITNTGGTHAHDRDVSQRQPDVQNPAIGEYVWPRYGRYTRLRYECGYSGSGVLGYIELQGQWTWRVGEQLQPGSGISKFDGNVVWDPRLPGWGNPQPSSNSEYYMDWTNYIDNVHYANFGATGFTAVWGRNCRLGYCNDEPFTCNPESSAYGSSNSAWASGTGTRFVRLWLGIGA